MGYPPLTSDNSELNTRGGAESPCRPVEQAVVSVVIPCLNEGRTIASVLECLSTQYPLDSYEILIVDGISSDNTRSAIGHFHDHHPQVEIRVLDNPGAKIPTALNLGISAARGDVIVRMDGHSLPSPNYVRGCVERLNDDNIAVVGMPWRIVPGATTYAGKSIAAAVAHWFAAGDAKYRLAGSAKCETVDTVPFGCFRKSTWEHVGKFNEHLLTNEDYDFNFRVRQNGGRVVLDRSGFCTYLARPSFAALARQYWRYGRWKAQMLRRQPGSLKLRHTVAPAFVLSLAVLAFLAPWQSAAIYTFIGIAALYLLAASYSAAEASATVGSIALIPGLMCAFAIVHFTWCGSFLLSCLQKLDETSEL